MPVRTYVITIDEAPDQVPLSGWLPLAMGFEIGDGIREVTVDEEVIIVPRDESERKE